MTDLIKDSYVFGGGGVKLQAQYESSEPTPVNSFQLRVQSSGGYRIDSLGKFSSGTRTHTISGDSCNVYATSGTLNGRVSAADDTSVGTVAGGNVSFGPGGMVVEVTTTDCIGVRDVKAIPGTTALVYCYLS